MQDQRTFDCLRVDNIAVFADQHFKVEKVVSGERTVSNVRRMTRKEQEDEIARMAALQPHENVVQLYGVADLPNGEMVQRFDSYLYRTRAALPAPARAEIDAISARLGPLKETLQRLDTLDPEAQDARRLMSLHLPGLIDRYHLSTTVHNREQLDMLARARRKATDAGVEVSFAQGDASDPRLEPGAFDVVLCRHVLWALPDPSAALARWVALLRPGGRLVLVEGNWSTGAGLGARRTVGLVREHRESAEVTRLTDPVYWGKEIDDERYLLVSLH